MEREKNMATRQVMVDDVDGNEDDVQTVAFGYEGTNFTIDLGKENRERLEEFLGEFIQVARPVGGRPVNRRKRVVNRKMEAREQIASGEAEIPALAELPDFDTKLARAWLKEHSFPVPDRGKLRAEVVLPYVQSDAFRVWQAGQAEGAGQAGEPAGS